MGTFSKIFEVCSKSFIDFLIEKNRKNFQTFFISVWEIGVKI
jgi:hypothetical protein